MIVQNKAKDDWYQNDNTTHKSNRKQISWIG